MLLWMLAQRSFAVTITRTATHTQAHTEAARGAAETDNNAHLVAHAAQSDGSRAVRQSVT